MYKGDNDYIAMELYRGRLRVSYDTGSYPPSAIYRYDLKQAAQLCNTDVMFRLTFVWIDFSLFLSVETVNDGSFHVVELVTSDQTLSLSIDGGSPKTINSISKQSTLNKDSPLYLGGMDTETDVNTHTRVTELRERQKEKILFSSFYLICTVKGAIIKK